MCMPFLRGKNKSRFILTSLIGNKDDMDFLCNVLGFIISMSQPLKEIASIVFGLSSPGFFLETQAGVCMQAPYHNYYKVIYTQQTGYTTTVLASLWITNTPLNGCPRLSNQSLTGKRFGCFQSFTFLIFLVLLVSSEQTSRGGIAASTGKHVGLCHLAFLLAPGLSPPQPCQQSMVSNFWLLANLWVRHGFHSGFFHPKWEIFYFNP